MPTKDIESIHAVVSSTLSFHDKYSITMKIAFRFSCELFVLGQVVMYGVLSAKDLWTVMFGVLGVALIVGTAIALHIYNQNAKDLEDHSKVISDIEHKPKKEQLENIEKFAYNYAVGYELFTDQWRTAQQLLLTMPFEQDELDRLLRSKQQIELQDSLSTYILQVTDKRMAGEPMPIEYARPEIEKAVLSQRRVLFLQKERERLYEDALRHKKIQFFESH